MIVARCVASVAFASRSGELEFCRNLCKLGKAAPTCFDDAAATL
jgi:hypothetical protein